MKKIIYSTLLLLAFSYSTKAQEVRLNAYSSYTFDYNFDSYYDPYRYYNGTLNDGLIWGGGLEYLATPEAGIELAYYRRDTKAPTSYVGSQSIGLKYSNFDVNMNYLMLGGTGYARANDLVEGFAGANFGVMWGTVTDDLTKRSGSNEKFSFGLKLGANVWATPKVAVKVQAQLLTVMQGMGGSVYFGTGGVGAGYYGYAALYQFCLGGGLTFKLGE